MKRKSIYILFIIFFTFNKVDAQSIYPVLMEQFDNGFHFINPAKPLIKNNFELQFADKKYFGLFENIGVNFFSSRANLSPKYTNKSNVLSLQFIHEYDGDFLNRSRVNLSYLFQTKINSNSEIGLGFTGGLFNYFVKSTSTNNGASIWLPDANVGLWYINKSINMGLAMNQITNATDKLYVRTFQLSPYYILNFDYQYNYKPQLSFKPGFIFKKYNFENQLDIFFIINNNKHLNGGLNWKINRGFAFIFGIENIEVLYQKINITCSYSVQNINESSFNSNQLELCLKYIFKNKR